ncbi:hypothetical protein [Methylomicrobium lacus]|uniref:hypothetical protein n=1 Tax=Methylomicrobium lacus TaxID=136992 RepID=UPI0035A87D4A
MNIKSVRTKIVLGIMMVGMVINADAGENRPGHFETPYNGIISGTATSAPIDAVNSGDGVDGVLGTFAITTQKFGQVTGQALVEDVPAAIPSGTCPPETDFELALGAIDAAHRFSNGDQLFLKGHTRTACVDLDTGTAVAHESGEFTGGTGQFSEASGIWDITDKINLWTTDPSGHFFASYTGQLKGTIITSNPLHIKK